MYLMEAKAHVFNLSRHKGASSLSRKIKAKLVIYWPDKMTKSLCVFPAAHQSTDTASPLFGFTLLFPSTASKVARLPYAPHDGMILSQRLRESTMDQRRVALKVSLPPALARKGQKALADGGPRPSGRGILAKESKGARPSAPMDYGQLAYL